MLYRLFATSHPEDYQHGGEPFAVVTGSTDGIGKAYVHSHTLLMREAYINLGFYRTANELLSKGFNVLVHGRNPAKLATTVSELKSLHPNRRIESVIADFSKISDVSAIPNYIKTYNLHVTIFINNVAALEDTMFLFEDLPDRTLDLTLNVAITYFTKLCQLVLPILKESSKIGPVCMANIGSAAGELPLPYLAVYAGTKGYVLVCVFPSKHDSLSDGNAVVFHPRVGYRSASHQIEHYPPLYRRSRGCDKR